ncbi:hypothetical protein OU798_16365 [Prolixibacteraceae bacterium Z1-6]|uniref:Sensor of ECF-type sigma factor n=1 Tax=Draconibacterium aestuarii TaxID=2998507 RepID=A0A9X3F7E6_9BACT|nr:hypothetical protein [Prolixibacteraceae bacterium Z1-6]
MKKLFFITMFLIAFVFANSQTFKSEIESAIEEFEKGKRVMVSNFVDLPENNVFWTIYDEFEKEREVFAKKQKEILLEYIDNYSNYSEERLEVIMDKNIENRNNIEKLRMRYFKKIKKECGSKVASQFWMVQRYFESTLNSRILGQLPILEN